MGLNTLTLNFFNVSSSTQSAKMSNMEFDSWFTCKSDIQDPKDPTSAHAIDQLTIRMAGKHVKFPPMPIVGVHLKHIAFEIDDEKLIRLLRDECIAVHLMLMVGGVEHMLYPIVLYERNSGPCDKGKRIEWLEAPKKKPKRRRAN
jgi:hypothetical protein